MSKSKQIIKYDPEKLLSLIQKWKINQTVLSAGMNMPKSVFYNKLYRTQQSYFFSDLEYIMLLEVLLKLTLDIKSLTKSYGKGGTMVFSKQSKPAELS